MPVTSPLERPNGEIRGRSEVVCMFLCLSPLKQSLS